MILDIDPHVPEHWIVAQATRVVERGGVVVVPTDTVYGVACDVNNQRAAERIYALKGMDRRKLLSILCADMAMASDYTRGIPTSWFRILKRELPGPFTFILPASKQLPRVMLKQRKTVGIRVPDCPITLELVRQLGRPLLSTSIRADESQWLNDPHLIEETFRHELDLVINGGPLIAEPSTIIDLSGRSPELIRQGKGEASFLD